MFVSTELFQWQNRKQIELKDLEASSKHLSCFAPLFGSQDKIILAITITCI